MRSTLKSPQSTSEASGLSKLRIDRREHRPERPKGGQHFVVITITALIVLGTVLLSAHMLTESVPEVQTVRVTSIASGGPGIALSATGYIVAHHKIDVNSKITGRVKWIGVEKGDHVTAEQVLVELEDEEFRAQLQQARGQVEAARASLHELEAGSRPEEIEQALNNLEQASATVRDDKITLDRIRQLAQEGVVARQQLDDARARYEADERKAASLSQSYALTKLGPREDEIQRARGNLVQAEGQLAYAQAQLAATRIRAPLSGTILERTAEKGELVTSTIASAAAGGPLGSVVSLADLNDLQVELDIAQNDFAKLHPQARGIVTTDAYPDRKFQGVLTEVSPEANRQKATVQVKVRIENPDDYLRPDMNATVQFLSDATATAETATGVLVPTNSLHTEAGHQYVLIAFNDHVVVREVRVVGRRWDGVVVDGLSGGEDVIIGTAATLKDGSRIKRKR